MLEVVFATQNKGKLAEARRILAHDGLVVLSPADVGFDEDVLETGHSFKENALIKARAVAAACGRLVIADDSGISIDFFLNGPGIYSARFLGANADYGYKNGLILDMMKRTEKRGARYVCAIACVAPNGAEFVAESFWHGEIAKEPSGTGGFGYDPIFFLPDWGKTAADLEPEQKNECSHRGKALRAVRGWLFERLPR